MLERTKLMPTDEWLAAMGLGLALAAMAALPAAYSLFGRGGW